MRNFYNLEDRNRYTQRATSILEELMTDDAQELGRRIIDINRKARLGTTTTEEWRRRIDAMLAAQPDLGCELSAKNVRFLQGGAGSSSGTLLFDIETKSGPATESEFYVLRFTPAEKLFHAYDLDGQIRIQRALASSPVPVPRQCWEDLDGEYLVASGYVMERAPGEAAPGAWFAEGIIAEASPADRRKMVLSFTETLAAIHAVDWREMGLSFLLKRARGEGLIAREINWYWDGLSWAGENDAMERFAGVREWLLANQPGYARAVLCHGDANFTNYLFKDNAVSAVLDWEMAFIGTPEADMTYALNGMSALSSNYPEGIPTDQEIMDAYEAASGRKLVHWNYYTVFSLYRIVLTHILGLRAFPDDFKLAFKSHVDKLVTRLDNAWEEAKRAK